VTETSGKAANLQKAPDRAASFPSILPRGAINPHLLCDRRIFGWYEMGQDQSFHTRCCSGCLVFRGRGPPPVPKRMSRVFGIAVRCATVILECAAAKTTT
jgi:hypothetical protein